MTSVNIAGVQFRRAGRIYDFLVGELMLHVGDNVVVETDRGPSLAKVAQLRFAPAKGEKSLKAVVRKATERDLDEAKKLTPEHAVQFTRERVERLGLKMTVLQAEVQFGGNKVIIYFSAPGRVDFRELVKELAGGLRARVELKQVGARDEAKLVGGIGVCGREYCCSSFLRDFVPVSIKMAKNQNLALNPAKVSGGCGRLLCCLTYENEMYTELRSKLPPRGTWLRVKNDDHFGVEAKILKSDVLNQSVLAESADGRLINVRLRDAEILEKRPTPAGSSSDSQVEAKAADSEQDAEAWGEGIDLDVLTDLEDPVATEGRAAERGDGRSDGPTSEHRRDGDRPSDKEARGRNSRGSRGSRGRGRRRGRGRDRSSAGNTSGNGEGNKN